MATPAVGLERISRVVGYKLSKGNFSESSPNLPQRIAILGEANTANQSGLSTAPLQITSAQQAGQTYGFGSPIHIVSRILFPVSGDGVGGIPVVVYPQAAAGGSAARVQTITVSGTATANGTHYVTVAGRDNVDGSTYAINVVSGDTATAIAAKIADAINGVLQAPVSASSAAAVVTATAKWTGLTSQGIGITVDTANTTLGVTYVVAQTAAGSGTPDIAAALALFGSEWNTIVVNTYGTVTTVLDTLENVNGIPDPNSPTGRFGGLVMKPFIAITGSVADDPTSVTDGRLDDVTIAIAPAPLSAGSPMEAAANMAVLFGRVAQDEPHRDVAGRFYPDMPAPTSTPAMASYNVRDSYVKKGCSTVDVVSGRYQVQDFVTTYHPVGEVPPQFRYARNLMLDFNVRYAYYLLELIHVVDHAIAADADIVSVDGVVKPKMWKQVIKSMLEDLAARALIADVPFSLASLTVDLSTTNPDRLETFFRYKRSGFMRIASTTAEAGFNFGTA
jgi:phage tail sheath gpL-like